MAGVGNPAGSHDIEDCIHGHNKLKNRFNKGLLLITGARDLRVRQNRQEVQ